MKFGKVSRGAGKADRCSPLSLAILMTLLLTGSSLAMGQEARGSTPAGEQTDEAKPAPWTWPEKPQNLQRLPATWSGQRLSPVMRGFTRALGVRCSHCHVGEEGEPLSTYDFASDENPKKEVARKMLDLLGTVNDELDEIGFDETSRVNMWCHTCHRGAPKPRTLGEELQHTYETKGAAAAAAQYSALRESHYGASTYDFSRPAFDWYTSSLVEQGKAADALQLLRADLEFHPDKAGVHQRLAEAYAALDRRELAVLHAERAVLLSPDDPALVQFLVETRQK